MNVYSFNGLLCARVIIYADCVLQQNFICIYILERLSFSLDTDCKKAIAGYTPYSE